MCSETRLWGSHTETQVNVTTNTLGSLSVCFLLPFVLLQIQEPFMLHLSRPPDSVTGPHMGSQPTV